MIYDWTEQKMLDALRLYWAYQVNQYLAAQIVKSIQSDRSVSQRCPNPEECSDTSECSYCKDNARRSFRIVTPHDDILE